MSYYQHQKVHADMNWLLETSRDWIVKGKFSFLKVGGRYADRDNCLRIRDFAG